MGNKLGKLRDEDIKLYTFDGIKKKCKVVKVYDGDTITIIFKNRGQYEKHKLRLFGIDTPELKPLLKNKNREEEIQKAIIARDKLKELILDKIIDVEFTKEEKYGRLLGTIYKNKININQWMIDNKYGVSYFFGKNKNI